MKIATIQINRKVIYNREEEIEKLSHLLIKCNRFQYRAWAKRRVDKIGECYT